MPRTNVRSKKGIAIGNALKAVAVILMLLLQTITFGYVLKFSKQVKFIASIKKEVLADTWGYASGR